MSTETISPPDRIRVKGQLYRRVIAEDTPATKYYYFPLAPWAWTILAAPSRVEALTSIKKLLKPKSLKPGVSAEMFQFPTSAAARLVKIIEAHKQKDSLASPLEDETTD